MHLQLKTIRDEIGLSIRDMADTLGIPKATFQCYENGRRSAPPEIIQLAETRLEQHRDYLKYWADLTQRIDESTPHGVRNEAMKWS